MTLHPFLAEMIERQNAMGGRAFSDGSPMEARALLAMTRDSLGVGAEMAEIRDLSIPTRSGAVPGRLLVPRGNVLGLIVYLHGGGWAIGCIDDFDTLARELAHQSRCSVLAVDYRLAPENPFPAAIEDAEDALIWSVQSTAMLLGRRAPVAVVGDSAGANLATVAARRLREQVSLAFQLLIYPVTDSDFESPSYKEYGTGLPLTRRDMEWFFELYSPQTLWRSPDISPLRACDLEGLPPALVVTAEYDALRSEGHAYAEALSRAGVPVALRQFSGVTHGFIRLHHHIDVAMQAVCDSAAAVAESML